MRETISRFALLRPGEHLGVAVSGGADSVALALLLQQEQHQLGIRLSLLHFNHQLRGSESEADFSFVRDFAAAQDLELFAAGEDVAAYARRQRCNLEEAGRRLRYAFFADLVSAGRVTRVATAHTADDQAETVLAQIARGTGPAGLAGIYPVAGPVVRPLLELRREELRDFLCSRGQRWREDHTNLDESRLRARIRRRLMPLLQADFHPAIVTHLAAMAEFARQDEAFWHALVEERIRHLPGGPPGNFHRCARRPFSAGELRSVVRRHKPGGWLLPGGPDHTPGAQNSGRAQGFALGIHQPACPKCLALGLQFYQRSSPATARGPGR
jgi:tRNA(Ile)-lysidine synthase